MQERIRKKAKELLESGECSRVLGWRAGEFCYDVTPAVFTDPTDAEKNLVFNIFCGANLSKYLIAESRKDGKTAAFLKPCDIYSFAQLQKEHRVRRENVYAVGVACTGTGDLAALEAAGCRGVLAVEEQGETLKVQTLYGGKTVPREQALLERCRCCKSGKMIGCDEILGEQGDNKPSARFDEVERLESMTAEERFRFWRGELSRCIRCNACRNVCPACSCEQCVFDDPASGVENKAPADPFEENLFHIIRAFHVAGRCTDCGECSRVCPQHIPLHLLNRKFIKDINEMYGPYQAGENPEQRPPLVDYAMGDPEPSIVQERGRRK